MNTVRDGCMGSSVWEEKNLHCKFSVGGCYFDKCHVLFKKKYEHF